MEPYDISEHSNDTKKQELQIRLKMTAKSQSSNDKTREERQDRRVV